MKDYFVGGCRTRRFISGARYMIAGLVTLGASALVPLSGVAQDQQRVQTADYTIVSRSANSQVWQRAVPIATNQQGQVAYITNKYTEVGTGINHLVNGQWVPSSENITVTPTGGAATNGQHQVGFATDINTSNAVEIITPDGVDLRTHIMGMSYFEPSTGSNVLFAELQDANGWLVGSSNQVVYSNAFTDCDADVKYTYGLATFEQDVLVRKQLPLPSSYGLSANCFIEIWTEFLNQPTPAVIPIQGGADVKVDFGATKIIKGKAFAIGSETNAVMVTKQWLTIQGRTFLVEQIPYIAVAAALQSLPPLADAGANGSASQAQRHQNFPKELPPPPQLAQREGGSLKVATSSAPMEQGLVMDYTTIDTDQSAYTFEGDNTYFISGLVGLSGTTTIQRGAILKYSTNTSSILVEGPLVCESTMYEPGILTSMNDNTAGVSITGSTGHPAIGTDLYLWLDNSTNITNVNNLRMSFASAAIDAVTAASNLVVRDCQFVSNYCGIDEWSSTNIVLENDLFAGGYEAIEFDQPYPVFLAAENVTATNTYFWTDTSYAPLMSLTNCIIVGTFNTPASLSTNCTVFNPGGAIFQSVGAGSFYLVTNSPYQNAGTTNIDPNLLADLGQKTTYPPIWFTNTISTDTTLFPQAQRDTDTPDLGYHYDPIDYLSSFVVTNAILTLTNGVVLGYYSDYGVWAQNNASLVSQGSPLQMDRFAYYNLVQEQSIILPGSDGPGDSLPINLTHTNYSQDPSISLRFTTINVPQGAADALFTGETFEVSSMTLRDCEIYGAGSIWSENQTVNPSTFSLQNNLFYEMGMFAFYSSDVISLYNNLFYGTSNESVTEFNFTTGTVTNHDNVFESLSSVTLDGTNGYNGFVNINSADISPTPGATDVTLSSFTWQTGPLGTFYQPTNSAFIAKGSRSAAAAGLYHYTVLTDQSIEDGATNVTMGYHYVALDTNGLPLDSNGDGIPDYLEDANGNGIYDAGDIGNWAAGYTNADSTGAVGLHVFTPLH